MRISVFKYKRDETACFHCQLVVFHDQRSTECIRVGNLRDLRKSSHKPRKTKKIHPPPETKVGSHNGLHSAVYVHAHTVLCPQCELESNMAFDPLPPERIFFVSWGYCKLLRRHLITVNIIVVNIHLCLSNNFPLYILTWVKFFLQVAILQRL